MNLKERLTACISAAVMLFSLAGCSNAGTDLSPAEEAFVNIAQYAHGNAEVLTELLDTGKIGKKALDTGLAVTDGENRQLLAYRGASSSENILLDVIDNGYYRRLKDTLRIGRFDLSKKDENGDSILGRALSRRGSASAYSRYRICRELTEHGAEIYPELFMLIPDDNGMESYSGKMMRSPMTVRMLFEKYFENDPVPDIPETIANCFKGDIAAAVSSAEKDRSVLAGTHQFVADTYAAAFGTVEQFETLISICGEPHVDRDILLGAACECGNADMVKYLFEKYKIHINEGGNEKYQRYMSRAAQFGQYGVCKYFIDEGIKPDHTVLAGAMLSDDTELFDLIYGCMKEKGCIDEVIAGETIEEFASFAGVSEPFAETQKAMIKQMLGDYRCEIGEARYICDDDLVFLIENGCPLNTLANDIIRHNKKKAVQAAINAGYTFTGAQLTQAAACCSSDTLKLILDSGAPMEEGILDMSYYNSRASLRLLIERGAETDREYGSLIVWNGSSGKKDNKTYRLKDRYISLAREDLAAVLDEYAK